MWHESEWGIYTVGQVQRLADLAGAELQLPAVELPALLASQAVVETMEEKWILGVKSINEVYVDLIKEFLEATQQ